MKNKSIIILITCLLILPRETVWAQASRSIHVNLAGTLSTLILESEKYNIEELTLTGELNGTDFRLLRDMAGNNYLGEMTDGRLKVLDLSGAHIVAGGEKYLDTDRIIFRVGGEGGDFHLSINNNNELSRSIFAGCILTHVSIPNSVTIIGYDAFGGCSSLTSVTIPNSVMSINSGAFSECSSLTSVTIPNSVTAIGSLAFEWCSHLTDIIVLSDNSYYKSEAGVLFNKNGTELLCYPAGKTELNYSIPNSVTDIGSYAFQGCSSLTSVTIPNSVMSINSGAFSDCSSLTSVTIPNSVTAIGSSAFDGCSSLTSVTIPNSVTTIGRGAFNRCSSLTSVTIPNSVKTIGDKAFHYSGIYNAAADGIFYVDQWCCGYKGEEPSNILSFKEGTRGIASSAFYGCSSLTSVTIPNSVTAIGSLAFANCSSLTSVTIPNSVIIIGQWAFSRCSSLTSVTIPNSVTTIGEYTFNGCSSLTSVTIPNSVTTIGIRAFDGCSSLTSVISEIVEPFEIDNVFSNQNYNTATLTVPQGTKDAYQQTAGWENFSNIVEAQGGNDEQFITFADAEVKRICVENWDTNGDGELSYAEAEAVTSFGTVFKGNESITSFNEAQYFTGVTSIEIHAFSGCSSLTSVTIPNSVTTIGGYAFKGCNSLTSVTIPNSVTTIGYNAFQNCSSLTSVTIPNSVTTIREYAFLDSGIYNDAADGIFYVDQWCCGYKGEKPSNILTLKEGTRGIADDAFEGCSSLTSVTIPNSVKTIGSAAFFNCSSLTSVTIPNSVITIGSNAFTSCSSLTSVTIPNSVTSIGKHAFEGCSSLTDIIVLSDNSYYKSESGVLFNKSGTELICYPTGKTELNYSIPNSVMSIGSGAFYRCSSLISVTIPNSVMSIGSGAFFCCSSLTSVTIPNSVTTIGDHAFYACISLTSVTFSNSVTTIGESAFYNCRSLTSVTIPNSVTTIGDYAFNNCNSLTEIIVLSGNSYYKSEAGVLFNKIGTELLCYPAGKTEINYCIPNSVKTIGGWAFSKCSSLTSVTIPNSVTTIGYNAFSGCTSLTSVTIPNSVTTIVESAFSGCSSLTSVISEIVEPFEIKKNVFSTYNTTILTVPYGTKEAYGQTEGWNEFIYIVEVQGSDEQLISFTDSEVGRICVEHWDTNGDGELSFAEAKAVTSFDTVFKGNESITSFNEAQYFTGVTSIVNYAFSGCSNLTSVTIPNSVTTIGSCTFENCKHLTLVIIPNSVITIDERSFYRCSSLTSVTIPNSVTTIGRQAFFMCSSLTSVTIPNSVTAIGDEAFSGCRRLTSVTIPNSMTDINDRTFYDCSSLTSVIIPNSVITIGYEAFYGCKSLTSLTIPNSVTSIGSAAFYECSSLTSVTIPNSVETIGGYAFYGCSSLTSVTIPNSVITIGGIAFGWCSHLTDIIVLSDNSYFKSEAGVLFSKNGKFLMCYPAGKTEPSYNISNNVTYIDIGAFYGCSNLTSVTIPNSVTTIRDYAFCGCTSLTSVTIPNSVTAIGSSAFYGCSSLTSVAIPNSVTDISYRTFSDCSSLTSVTIPNSVTAIDREAFYGCRSLISVTIPNSVTAIRKGAFMNCSSLTSVISEIVEPFEIDFNVFSYQNYNTTALIVPHGTKAAYQQTAGWKEFNLIVEALGSEEDPTEHTIHVATAGTLPDLISETDKYNIEELTLTGELNGTDFRLLRDMAGCNYLGEYTDGRLKVLDISGAKIVKGGEMYIDANNLPDYNSSTGFHYSVNQNDVLPQHVFHGCKLILVTIPNSVKTISNYAFHSCSSLISVTIPNSVKYIGDDAFKYCSSLTSVTIPNSVGYIGNDAFYGCSSLTSVTIPNSVTTIGNFAFYECNSLTSVTIPNSIITIRDLTFYNCRSLTSVTIPNSVTTIGHSAFRSCSSLTSVTIPNSVTTIGESAFSECSSLTSVTIPNSVTAIGSDAFGWCSHLTDIIVLSDNSYFKSEAGVLFNKSGTELLCYPAGKTGLNYSIPNSVTTIGGYAFGGCSSLTSVTIPNSVTAIGDEAFYGCSSLTSVTIPNSVTTIGAGAFDYCRSLTSVTIPNSVMSIGSSAFYGCSRLTSVAIPNSVTTIGSSAFHKSGIYNNAANGIFYVDQWCCGYKGEKPSNILTLKEGTRGIANSAFSGCSSLTSVTIPNSVITIGNSAFERCSSLTSVTIPNSVTTIGSGAFYYCSSLTSVTIPNSVTTIGDEAFRNCSSLTSVTIPNSVTAIGAMAFYGCSSLTSVTIPNSVTAIGSGAFHSSGIYNDAADGIFYVDQWCCGYKGDKPSNILTLKEGTRGIASSAFYGCSSLTSVTIPNSVKTIGSSAFYNCSGLISVTIPNSVAFIGDGAFKGCSSLTSVISEIVEPFEINDDVFTTYDTATLTVPQGTKAAYQQTEGWKNFSNIVEAGSEVNEEWLAEVQRIRKEAQEGVAKIDSVIALGDWIVGCAKELNELKWNCNTIIDDANALETKVLSGNATVEDINQLQQKWDNYSWYFVFDNIIDPRELTITCSGSGYVDVDNGESKVREETKHFRYLVKPFGYDCMIKVIPDETYTISSILFNGYATEQTVFSTSDDFPTTLVVEFEPTTKPLLTLTANSYTRAYGEENPNFAFTADRDDYSGMPEISCEATAQSPVGEYPIIIKQGSVDYNNVNLVNGKLTITKASLTITADDKWMRQGEALPAFTAHYDGFKLGETEDVLTVKPQFHTTATTASPMGNYAITPSSAQAQNYSLTYLDGRLTIIGRRGDVNRDSYVNATDLADVIQYILGYPNLQAIYDADLNSDEQVTIADVTEVINCIMGSDRAASRRSSAINAGDIMLSMKAEGQGLLIVSLQNDIPLVAFQFDIVLPPNADIDKVLLSDVRSNGHMITTSKLEADHYRVLAYTMPNSPLRGISGMLATLQLTGTGGEVMLTNIHFADDQGMDYALPSMTLDMTTGISAISGDAAFDIYDLNGRLVRRQAVTTDRLQRGLYIINNKKVVIK